MSVKKTYSITEYEKHLNYICDKICTQGQLNNDLDTIVACALVNKNIILYGSKEFYEEYYPDIPIKKYKAKKLVA